MNPFELFGPGGPPFVVVLGLGLVASVAAQVLVLNRVTGWTTLAQAYPQRKPFHGKRWWFESGRLRRGMSFRGTLTVGANEEGLYVAMLWPLSLFSPACFVPWTDVRVRSGSDWGLFHYTELGFARAPTVPLRLRGDLTPRLAEAAGRAWPGES
jgi:hypothetical protein